MLSIFEDVEALVASSTILGMLGGIILVFSIVLPLKSFKIKLLMFHGIFSSMIIAINSIHFSSDG